MDLEPRLRAFAAVARKHSFSAAARVLRISQPAISKHVADIERHLGVRPVERRARGGELTAAGAFLADDVLRAEALLAQAARSVTEFHLPPTGSLTIAASGVPATYLIPEVAVAFQRAYPGVQVSIVPAPSAQTMDALRAHRAEFAVVGGFAARDRGGATGGGGHRGRRPSAVCPASPVTARCGGGDLIVQPQGSAFQAAVEAAWADLGITPARRLLLPTLEGLKLAVARGAGVAGCSRFAVEAELRRGSLALLSPGWKVRRTISIVRPRDTVLTPSAREFVALLRARWSRRLRAGVLLVAESGRVSEVFQIDPVENATP